MSKKWIVLYAIPILWYAAPLIVRVLGSALPSGLVPVWCAAAPVFAFGVFLKYALGFSLWLQDKYPESGVLSDSWGLHASRARARAMEDFIPEGGDAELDRRRKDGKLAFALFPVTGFLAVVWFLVYTGF